MKTIIVPTPEDIYGGYLDDRQEAKNIRQALRARKLGLDKVNTERRKRARYGRAALGR